MDRSDFLVRMRGRPGPVSWDIRVLTRDDDVDQVAYTRSGTVSIREMER